MWADLTGEVADAFASFAMDAIEEHQLDLFCHVLRQQAARRESHRERQRISQRTQPKIVRVAINAARKSYWRTYREKQRRAAGVQPRKRVTAEERREYRRQWMANKRAEARAA